MPDRNRARVTLVLGRMPADATPATHWAAGPWCFVGREASFPDWDRRFRFAPEPLAHRALQAQACAQAKALAVSLLPRVAAAVCPHHDTLPAVYWETLCIPWVMAVTRQLVERWWRVQALVTAWGQLPLHVELLPEDASFSFHSSQDFILRGALGHAWNHFVLSRLLETVFPAAWTRHSLPPVRLPHPVPPPRTLGGTLRDALRSLLLHLPFPPLKGMRLWQSLRYSLALCHRSHGQDSSTPLSAWMTIPPAPALAAVLAPPLPLDPLPLLLATLPADLARLRHPRTLTREPRGPRLRVATVRAYEDAAYRQRLALWRARGHRLMFVQHGGNYGQTRVVGDMELVEYSQHCFGTWGWTQHGDCRGHFLPVPYPQLAALRQRAARLRQADQDGPLLLVGTEMAAFPYRLDSLPTPRQLVTYRRDKARFLAALPQPLRQCLLYRPYFSVPGCLADAPWVQERFPEVRLATGPLEPHVMACRLLVLDHNGTSLLEALAANIPVVAFWRPEHWPLTDAAQALRDRLAAAGLWWPTPEQAAAHIADIWPHPWSWWTASPVQDARAAYTACQARCHPDGPDAAWLRLLQEV